MVYQQLKRKLLQNEGKPLYYLSYVVFKHETIIFSISIINLKFIPLKMNQILRYKFLRQQTDSDPIGLKTIKYISMQETKVAQ